MTQAYRDPAAPEEVPKRSWWCRHGFHVWDTLCTSYNDFRTVDKFCVRCGEEEKGKPYSWWREGGGCP